MNAEQIRQWREDAIADGWIHEAIYKHEPEDNATRLKREGWQAQVYLLPATRNHSGTQTISVWGPDSLHIKTPPVYNWDLLQQWLRLCDYCGAIGKTVRLGFAGRVCPECREVHKARVEYSGWTS